MTENSSSLDLNTLWVECKHSDGRSYYYNAKTRQTTWTKPEGQQVMSQLELDKLLAKQTQTSANIQSPSDAEITDEKVEVEQEENEAEEEEEENVDSDDQNSQSPKDVPSAPNYNPYSYPPPSLGMPLGSFPPHLMPHMTQMMQNGFPGFGSVPPPPHLLRFMMPPFLQPTAVQTGKSLETLYTELRKLRAQLKDLEEKMAKTNDDASNWSEFKNPEGRIYFYNSKTTESTWDKPIVLADVIDLQNQLEHVNKTIHESEKEVKRLENEQSQAAASATNDKPAQPQQQQQPQAAPTPAFLNGFTLEKMDTNDIRRLGDSSIIADRALSDDKSRAKSKPVSSKPIPGTPWCIVWTSDQQVFFFNPTSRTSLWDRPEELKGRSDVDEMIRAALPQDDPNRTKQKLESIANESEPDAKKIKSELILTSNENELKSIQNLQTQDLTGKTAAQQRELIPYEIRIKQFREMLAEKQVSAFATWEQELNKISDDPRYSLLTVKERKQEFDRYTHERADEERKEKEAKLKQKKNLFRDLLKDAHVSTRSTFNEFASRHSKDERFRAVERIRDRESWFHEYVQELKTREKDGSHRHHDKEKLKKDYFSLLKELKITKDSSWSETKRQCGQDSRYKSIESSSRREDWFREYQNKHSDETNDSSNQIDEEELERQREKERQERIDASIKKRAEEVKEQLSGVQRELDKEREQVKKEKAMENFKALLTDMVRTADAEWKETKKILKKDPRWEQDLDRDEKERLFEEHLQLLEKKRQIAFHTILNDHCTLTSTWKDVKKAIKSDARFEKIFANDRKRDFERDFEHYIKEQYKRAKTDFEELLKETKLITYKSLQTIEESEDQNHLRDIEKILEKDKRYLLLEVIPEQRSEILMDYIVALDKLGAPPPPTAPLDKRKHQDKH